jgi:predicted molibdopterin-dependent oxidoreductase YjgC
MPTGIFPEVDGTVMNFQGRVQVMRAAYPPPFLARTGVKVLNGLAAALDAGSEALRPRDLFDQMAEEIPAFAGMTFSGLGGMGRPLPAATTAGGGA